VATALLYKNRYLEVVVEPVELWAKWITRWLYSRYDVFNAVDPLWSLDGTHMESNVSNETVLSELAEALRVRIKYHELLY
jgi:hypothetical protein